MRTSRVTEPRIRKSAKSRELATLRRARNAAEKAGNWPEAERLERILGRLVGM